MQDLENMDDGNMDDGNKVRNKEIKFKTRQISEDCEIKMVQELLRKQRN